MSTLLSKRYAQAIFDAAIKLDKVETIYEDLTALGNIVRSSEEFKAFITNPALKQAYRDEILVKLFKDRCDSLTTKFLLFLSFKGRLDILSYICLAFEDFYLAHKNIIKIKIISSSPLSTQQVNAISQHLKLRWRKEVQSEVVVRPELIGGIKIQIGDQIHDSSIFHILESFREQIVHA